MHEQTGIIALDLGTSSFKAAWIAESGQLGPVFTQPVRINRSGPQAQCPPERYRQSAFRAIADALANAREAGVVVTAIGLTSQAQTFVTVTSKGETVGHAVVWLDSTANEEADRAAEHLPNFARQCGFYKPSPQQFLPHVMQRHICNTEEVRYLLLNEWIALQLTGVPIGDSNQQAMGGFWDLQTDTWNDEAMAIAAVTPINFGLIGKPGALFAPLLPQVAGELSTPPIPVYSCGNDQTAAATGAGLCEPGNALCNFGTAAVVYGLCETQPVPKSPNQIAGRSAISGLWYLLAFCESATEPTEQVRRFAQLLDEMKEALGAPQKLIPSGGRFRHPVFRELLRAEYGDRIQRKAVVGSGLLGVTEIIRMNRGAARGAQI